FFPVHPAVAISVGEDGNAIDGRTVLRWRSDAVTGILPRSGLHLPPGFAASVGILGRLGDPEPAGRIPVEVDRFVDQWLRRHQLDGKVGMDLELCSGFLRGRRAAFGIT